MMHFEDNDISFVITSKAVVTCKDSVGQCKTHHVQESLGVWHLLNPKLQAGGMELAKNGKTDQFDQRKKR